MTTRPITIGADPEFFIASRETGDVVPVCGLMGGTKKDPIKLKKEGMMYHEDNVTIEIGFDPVLDQSSFYFRTLGCVKAVNKILYDRGYSIVTNGMTEFQFAEHQLQSEQAQTFGCDPDFNAYEGGAQRGDPPSFGNWRFAGGHVHIGGKFPCPPFVVALLMDVALGLHLPSMSLIGGERKKWYGQPGIFREKPYGIEYRSLPNAWATGGMAEYVGANTLALGHWLTQQTPEYIRKFMESLPWMEIRSILSTTYERDEPYRTAMDRCYALVEDCRSKGFPPSVITL